MPGTFKTFPPLFLFCGGRKSCIWNPPSPSPTTSFPLHRLRCEGREGEREREREAEKLQNGREGLLEGLLRHLPYSFGGRRDSSPSLSPDHPSSIYVYTRGLTNKQDPPPFPLWSLFMGVGRGGSERRGEGEEDTVLSLAANVLFPFFFLCSRVETGFFLFLGSFSGDDDPTALLPCSRCM